MKNPPLEIGQVYIEDLGPGRAPNQITITEFGMVGLEPLVRYTVFPVVYGSRYKMVRRRFEGLIKSGVFVLQPKQRAKNETETRFDKAALTKEIADLKEAVVMWRAKYVSLRNRMQNIKLEVNCSDL